MDASRFTLTIKLGNAAMMTPADIAAALREVADDLADGLERAHQTASPHVIRDVNGNPVGEWAAR